MTMQDKIIDFIHTFLFNHAPMLLKNPLPLYLVAGFILVCGALWFYTKGREFAWVASSSLMFLIPFIKI